MTIRMKMVWMMSIWLICILLCLNFVIYYVFIRLATDNEREMLQSKMDNIIENVSPAILMQRKQDRMLMNFLPDNSMLRVMDIHSQVVNQVSDDPIAASIHSSFSTHATTQVTTVKDDKVLVMEEPIMASNGNVEGVLIMSVTLISLEGNIRVLIYLLLFSSIGAVILCFVGGWLLSGTILNPIRGMIQTMQEVESSLIFKKIPLISKSKDELYKMGATFNRMIERIEQSFLKQRQFISDASHELKTPLTIIESYVNMLRRWGTQDENVREEAILAIHEESNRMKQMIQQLLNLATYERGEEITLESVDLVAVSREAAKLFNNINQRLIRVLVDDEPVMLLADRNKIKQLLLILLDNAVKYSYETIDIYIHHTERDVELIVKDYGAGIPKDELELVFERFYRVDKARQRKTGGTGLGLSIAKAIVSQHGGKVFIDSVEGQGTEVHVYIPKLRADRLGSTSSS